jgi:hypothetical protein
MTHGPDGATQETKWLQAGMGVGDSGELDRDLPTGSWSVPAEVRVKGDLLVWRWATPSGGCSHHSPAGAGVLEALLDVTATESIDKGAIIEFAERWGVLGICGHGLPATHRPALNSPDGPTCSPQPVRADRTRLIDWRQEPLTKWQEIGQRARALLTVAAAVHDEKPAPFDTWSDAAWGLPTHSGSERRFIPAADRQGLADAVNRWLTISAVSVAFEWQDDRSVLTLHPRSLVGAVALQLAMSAARTDGLRLCSNCGRPYVPDRKPAANRRSYCKDCRRRAAQRDAARDYRKRKKSTTTTEE